MANNQLLRYSKYLMVIGGVWRIPLTNDANKEKLYYAYAYALQSFYIGICFLMFIQFFFLLNSEDVTKLTDSIKITITCTLAAIKFIIFQNGKMPQLIQHMINEEKVILYSDDEQTKSIYLNFIKYINKCAVAVIVLAGGTAGFLVVATSVVGMMMKNNENFLSDKPMIFLAMFPFNQDQHYGLSLFIQGISIAIATVYYCMTQILYISVLIYAKAQLQILQLYFRNFDYYTKINKWNVTEIDMVKSLVKLHQLIIGFVKQLNTSLKYLLLIEFLLSSLNIASVAFQLIASKTITDLSFSFCYLIVLIGQLFILAWHANEIKIESIAVSDAVYESAWYEKNVEIKRILFLVMLRAQKPLTLTIGPFNPLTAQTVISVINAAYSYVTIMTSDY